MEFNKRKQAKVTNMEIEKIVNDIRNKAIKLGKPLESIELDLQEDIIITALSYMYNNLQEVLDEIDIENATVAETD